MKLNDIKKLVRKGIEGSAKKQLKVFLKNKETTEFFKQSVNYKGCK